MEPSLPLVQPSVLSDKEWESMQRVIPIACVDFVPMRRDPGGCVEIGLIQRAAPFPDTPEVWCHLGGRVRRDETVAEAMSRHAQTLIGGYLNLAGCRRPHALMEFFPTPRATGTSVELDGRTVEVNGVDPRKHAISVCYLVEAQGDFKAVEGGEAHDFAWYRITDLADLETWPGTTTMVEKALAAYELDCIAGAEQLENKRTVYESISNEALNHNSLVWQTPALALTAEAFLLTIALDSGSSVSARLISSGLNFMISILCAQLMSKHRAMVAANRDTLVDLESQLGITAVYHRPLSQRQFRGWAKLRSGWWWQLGFVVLAIVAAGIFVSTLIEVIGG